MNRSKLLMVALAMMIVLPCFAKKKVKLEGTWQGLHRSAFEEIPVEAWVEDDNKELLLEFSKNLGTVQVMVTNSVGEVLYSQIVETESTSSFSIFLNEANSKNAVLTVTNEKNLICGYLFTN